MMSKRNSSRSLRSSGADSDVTTPYFYEESDEKTENSLACFKDFSEGRTPRSVVNKVAIKSQSSSDFDPPTPSPN
jgi:hypothetical protein